jgi:hypothetical protein
MENTLDVISQILFFSAFAVPFITIVLAWRSSQQKNIYTVAYGLFIGIMISILLVIFSLAILFRNGLGPT